MSANTVLPLSHYLTKGQNSFGVLRLVAASAVVLSHSWPTTIGNMYPEPLQIETGYSLGWHSVNLFFLLSGILVAGSINQNRSVKYFVLSRFLRIYPALVVVILFTTLISAIVTDYRSWETSKFVEYVARNILLIGASAELPGIFENNPERYKINVPLWTLKYEVFAYFTIIGVSVLSWRFPRLFSLKVLTLAILLLGSLIMLTFGKMEDHGVAHHVIRLTFAFYVGVALWIWRDIVRVNIWIVAILIAVNATLLWIQPYYLPAQILLLGFIAVWIGTYKFGTLSKFTDHQDYSYGIYIMGFPIQQTVMAVTQVTNPLLNFSLAMLLTIPLAAISWNLIERPALKLRKSKSIR